MQLKITLKPNHVGGNTVFGTPASRDSVMRKICSGHYHTTGTYGTCLAALYGKDEYVRVYSIEKRRKKSTYEGCGSSRVVQVPRGFGHKNEGEFRRVIGKKGLRKTHWVGVYYDIPHALLKAAGLKVEQGLRTWKFVKA